MRESQQAALAIERADAGAAVVAAERRAAGGRPWAGAERDRRCLAGGTTHADSDEPDSNQRRLQARVGHLHHLQHTESRRVRASGGEKVATSAAAGGAAPRRLRRHPCSLRSQARRPRRSRPRRLSRWTRCPRGRAAVRTLCGTPRFTNVRLASMQNGQPSLLKMRTSLADAVIKARILASASPPVKAVSEMTEGPRWRGRAGGAALPSSPHLLSPWPHRR